MATRIKAEEEIIFRFPSGDIISSVKIDISKLDPHDSILSKIIEKLYESKLIPENAYIKLISTYDFQLIIGYNFPRPPNATHNFSLYNKFKNIKDITIVFLPYTSERIDDILDNLEKLEESEKTDVLLYTHLWRCIYFSNESSLIPNPYSFNMFFHRRLNLYFDDEIIAKSIDAGFRFCKLIPVGDLDDSWDNDWEIQYIPDEDYEGYTLCTH
jgi:hypothetical protein